MMFKTHLLFALFISLLILNYFNLNPLIFILILVFSAILPDIDHSKSWIGRKIKILSWPINFIFGHRKLIHSLFFILIIGILIRIFFNNYYIPFVIGYLSHLFLDTLTKQGVYLFYPFKLRINGFIKTNGIIEKMFLMFLGLINMIYIVKILY